MSDDQKPPRYDRAVKELLEPWMRRLAELDATSGEAWDERDRRIRAGSATPEDVEVHRRARDALESGRPLPAAARRMPGPELAMSQRTWHPESNDNPTRAVSMGIPPLIADEVARGDGFETPSTRACARVGREYMLLVLVGSYGCGKTYAAARWLWRTRHRAPRSVERLVRPRRFIEAPALREVSFDDRPQLHMSSALVVDDLGAEQDFLRDDWARVLVARYKNGLPTVITTNLSERDFGSTYGGRVMDRIAEVGRVVVVSNSPGDSLRGKR